MTVVGVMPAEFEFPTERMEFLVPFDLGDASWQQGTRLTMFSPREGRRQGPRGQLSRAGRTLTARASRRISPATVTSVTLSEG